KFRVESLRADKGGECIDQELHDYCFQNRASLEYARTNTPQEISMPESVGRTLAVVERCMLTDSALPFFFS
ncbi:unnamed protein product, partial [Scytosiphon promiscuus]